MFGGLVVCYLFLGGTGAGLCLILAVLSLLSPNSYISRDSPARSGGRRQVLQVTSAYRSLFASGFAVACVVLLIAIVCLVADLGRADRILFLLTHPIGSYIAFGSYVLAACVALAVTLACAWSGFGYWRLKVVRVLESLMVVVAIMVMVYTGLMLLGMPAVPLWSTPWLPVLFVLSSLSCGVAVLLSISHINGSALLFVSVMKRLAALDALVIALEGITVILFVVTVSASGTLESGVQLSSGTMLAAADALRNLLVGSYAYLFWGCFIAVGLVVPFVLDMVIFFNRSSSLPLIFAAVSCVLAGGLALRYCMVAAGVHPVLMAPLM